MIKVPCCVRGGSRATFFIGQLAVIIALLLAVSGVQGQTTITKLFGGTVLYNGEPTGGITILVSISDSNANTTQFRQIVSDNSGYYSITVTGVCDPSYQARIGVGCSVIMDDGSLRGGGGAGGTMSCDDTTDFSQSIGIGVSDSAQNNQQNAGEGGCPTVMVGKPVNVTNGNMYIEQTDYSLPGIGEPLNVSRSYNSMIQAGGIFGFGWSTDLDEKIINYSDQFIRLDSGSGRKYYLGQVGGNVFAPAGPDIYGTLVKDLDWIHTLTFKDGRIHNEVV